MRLTLLPAVISLLIVSENSAHPQDASALGALTDAVTRMCVTPSERGNYLRVEGDLEAGAAVILKVLGANLSGKATYEQWDGINQALDNYQTDPRQCAIEVLKIIRPIFFPSASQPKPGAGAWPMLGYDRTRSAASPYFGPERPGVKWTLDIDTDGEFTQNIAIGFDDTLYIGTKKSKGGGGKFFSISRNGQIKWTYEANGGNGFRDSSPTIARDGTIYIGEGCCEGGLVALNPNGTLEWRFPDTGIANSPVIGVDGTIYARSYCGQIIALDGQGTLKWKTQWRENKVICGARQSLSIGPDRTLYYSNDSSLYAVGPDGERRWIVDLEKQSDGWTDHFYPWVVIDSQSDVYVSLSELNMEHNYALYGVSASGELKWKMAVEKQIQGMAMKDDILYAANCQSLFAITPKGVMKWRRDVGGCTLVVDAAGTIYLAQGGNVHAIEPDGSTKWEFDLESLNLGVATPMAIGEDSTLYLGVRGRMSESGKLKLMALGD